MPSSSIRTIVENTIEKKPKLVKEAINEALNQKAAEALQERKIDLAKDYLKGR